MSKEKRAELEIIAGTENPDLVGITETWAKKRKVFKTMNA